MATHYIPKNFKNETRILIIFSTKSLITTAIGGGIGALLMSLFMALGMKALGIVLLILFALIGYGVGTFKIPKITGLPFTKNVEGDSIDEILVRYVKFKSNKKVYSYTKEEK